jgi:hypothetical protein
MSARMFIFRTERQLSDPTPTGPVPATSPGVMKITTASPSDLDDTVACLATAFAQDPITGFLLHTGSGYRERVMQFFSLLMRARIALEMPVVVARGTAAVHGAAMGYATVRRTGRDDA